MENSNDVRKAKLEKYIKFGLVFGGAVIVSPIVFLAIKGLIGLAVAAVVGMGIIQFAPVVAVKIANARMKMLVSEVESNPIESMQNLHVEKQKELDEADRKIVEFETETANYDDQLGDFKKQYPSKAQAYQAISERMHAALEEMKREQEQARNDLNEFTQRIKEAKAIYKMSLAAQKVTQLSRSAEAQVFAKIREEVAFDSVRTQLNKSFATLGMALERRKSAGYELPAAKPAAALEASRRQTVKEVVR